MAKGSNCFFKGWICFSEETGAAKGGLDMSEQWEKGKRIGVGIVSAVIEAIAESSRSGRSVDMEYADPPEREYTEHECMEAVI